VNCPHCQKEIKYKERSGSKCSNCYKEFAFEPKVHPLLLSDKMFSKIATKLSDKDKLYFTGHQLQFALSRKKLKGASTSFILIVPAVITIIIAAVIFSSIAFIVAFVWVVIIIASLIYSKKRVSLPQSFDDFQTSVIERWRTVYKNIPQHLILNTSIPHQFKYPVKGILICETVDSAACLWANKTAERLSLAVFQNWSDNIRNETINLLQNHGGLPVYVLHDASVKGCGFFEQVKFGLNGQTQVIDMGLHPRAVMKSKLVQFRQAGFNAKTVAELESLTMEERKWLKDGFYTVLFELSPAKLIAYVKTEIKKNAGFVKSETTAQQKAEAVGFMTWLNE
jgi:hypothetical protein